MSEKINIETSLPTIKNNRADWRREMGIQDSLFHGVTFTMPESESTQTSDTTPFEEFTLQAPAHPTEGEQLSVEEFRLPPLPAETAEQAPYSRVAAAMNRLATRLNDRAERKAAQQAIIADQEAAYDSYDDNINYTLYKQEQVEERAARVRQLERRDAFDEKTEQVRETARQLIRRVGTASLAAVGFGVLAYETVKRGTSERIETAKEIATELSDKVTERRRQVGKKVLLLTNRTLAAGHDARDAARQSWNTQREQEKIA